MSITAEFSAALQGRYVIERELGRGGMATVYLARDLRHDRPVAIKVMQRDASESIGLKRFEAEVRLTARLDHPHILTLIDSGEADGLLFYVMPYVRGESLRARITREKRLPIEEAVRITQQVGSALAHAHGHGIVHRDVKPENVLLHEGVAMLADFGIAHEETPDGKLTETGTSLGTPSYMSPEQATGEHIDVRSDVYSLGALLYEMLTGELPISAATHQAFVAKLMTERPTRVRTLRDTVSESVEAAVMRALEKVPADRPQSVSEFVRSVKQERVSRRPSRKAVYVAVGGLVIASLSFLAANRLRNTRDDDIVMVDRRQVTSEGAVESALLSPDGKQLLYVTKQCDSACAEQVRVTDTRGGNARTVISDLKNPFLGEWSSDGLYVILGGDRVEEGRQVYLLSLVTGESRVLPTAAWVMGTSGNALVRFRTERSQRGDTLSWITTTDFTGQPRDSFSIRGNVLNIARIPRSHFYLTQTGNPADSLGDLAVLDGRGVLVSHVRAPQGLFQVTTNSVWIQAFSSTDAVRPVLRYPLDSRSGAIGERPDTVISAEFLTASVSEDETTVAVVERASLNDAYLCTFAQSVGNHCRESEHVWHSSKAGVLVASPEGKSLLHIPVRVPHEPWTAEWRMTSGPEWRPVPNTLDIASANFIDSVTLAYSTKGSRPTAGLMDVRTGVRRESVPIDTAVRMTRFTPGAGRVFLSRSSITYHLVDGGSGILPLPPDISFPCDLRLSRDASRIVVTGWGKDFDSLLVDVLSIRKRSVQRWYSFSSSSCYSQWQPNGSLLENTKSTVLGAATIEIYSLADSGSVKKLATVRNASDVWPGPSLRFAIMQTTDRRGDAWVSRLVHKKR